MEFSDVNRRSFLKSSASAATVAAGVSAGAANAAARSEAEVAEWQSRVGSVFSAGTAELRLKSVDTTDHSGDAARPSHCRVQSISLLFALQTGNPEAAVHLNDHGLHLSQVIAPQGQTGQYFEAILN